MNSVISMEQRLAAIEARLKSLLHPAKDGDRKRKPFVTISRETGAGGCTVGRLLVERLNAAKFAGGDWIFLDKELVGRALEHQNLPAALEKFLPEDTVNEIQATIGELVGLHPSLWTLNEKVAEAILRFAYMGNVVLAGRGATFITRKIGGVHVRLVGSLAKRSARMAEALKTTHTVAETTCLKGDLGRRRYVRSHFNEDVDDPLCYDLVINTDRVPPEHAAAMIASLLTSRSVG
jgi:cytidylate kinase